MLCLKASPKLAARGAVAVPMSESMNLVLLKLAVPLKSEGASSAGVL